MHFATKIPGANLRVVCRAMRTVIIDGERVMRPGFAAQFLNGIFSTDDPKQIKLLRENPAFGIDFLEVPGKDYQPDVVEEIPRKKKKKKRKLFE